MTSNVLRALTTPAVLTAFAAALSPYLASPGPASSSSTPTVLKLGSQTSTEPESPCYHGAEMAAAKMAVNELMDTVSVMSPSSLSCAFTDALMLVVSFTPATSAWEPSSGETANQATRGSGLVSFTELSATSSTASLAKSATLRKPCFPTMLR